MTKYDLKIGQEIQWAQGEADVNALYARRIVDRETPCRVSGTERWMDVNEFFPTLKYGCPRVAPPPVSSIRIEPEPLVDFQRDDRKKPALTSSLKAGWICFGLGLGIAWIFPPGCVFYSVALVLAVIAMATHQVNKGLALLLTTFAGMAISAMISFFLAVGLFAAAARPAIAKAERDAHQQQVHLLAAQQKMISSINNATVHPPAAPMPIRQSTPLPVQSMSKRQLFDEIARIEKQKRDRRRVGQDMPPETADYLQELQTALDAGS